MIHKRFKFFLLLSILGCAVFFIMQRQSRLPDQCVQAEGVLQKITQTCRQRIEKRIYKDLSTAYPIVINTPEANKKIALDKQRQIENSFYVQGFYQAVIAEAQDNKAPLYERTSIYLNLSKMRLLSTSATGLLYFAAPFAVNTGGSGVFFYIGLFAYDLQSRHSSHLDSVFLGDRIRAEKINLSGDMIRVDFLAHGAGQAYADDPVEPIEKHLQLLNLAHPGKSAKFKEVKRMHSSWDKNHDGLNDCETDGSCDHTVDYSKVRLE